MIFNVCFVILYGHLLICSLTPSKKQKLYFRLLCIKVNKWGEKKIRMRRSQSGRNGCCWEISDKETREVGTFLAGTLAGLWWRGRGLNVQTDKESMEIRVMGRIYVLTHTRTHTYTHTPTYTHLDEDITNNHHPTVQSRAAPPYCNQLDQALRLLTSRQSSQSPQRDVPPGTNRYDKCI